MPAVFPFFPIFQALNGSGASLSLRIPDRKDSALNVGIQEKAFTLKAYLQI